MENGFTISFIQPKDGGVETLASIIVTVAQEADGRAMFRAVRDGPLKHLTPPGEPSIMASMKTVLLKALAASRK